MTVPRVPTGGEYQNYDGGHCKDLWSEAMEVPKGN